MAPLRWGILSAGLISHDFCVALSVLPKEEQTVVAVAARDLEKAKAFAKLHEIPKAYGSYEELVKDPEIDVAYVGSINPQHFPLVKLALNNGKHVLCEKPMGMNVKETKEMIDLAKEKNLFLMEGLWTRFFPAMQELRKRIDDGSLGEVLQILVTMGEPMVDVDRLQLKSLGGGTTLDLGTYCVQLSEYIFREKPIKVISGGQLNKEGVDESASTTLVFSNGRTATLVTHSRVFLLNEAWVFGTKKTIKVRSPFWCSTEIEEIGGEVSSFPLPPEKIKCKFDNGTGMHYEAVEVRKCILEGKTESCVASHEHSLLIAEVMESIRKQIGVSYPQD